MARIAGQIHRLSIRYANRNPWLLGLLRLYHNKGAMIGLGIFLIICIACWVLPNIIKTDYYVFDFASSLQQPSSEHIFGTDILGRDMLSGVLYGGRITIRIAAAATMMAAILGSPIGLISGYFGGRVDFVISRFTDMLFSIPVILLTIVVELALGWGRGNFVYAMAISASPQFTRFIRAAVLNITDRDYIKAAQVLGLSPVKIIFQHILRNVSIPLITQITGYFSEAVLTCTILGYLGVGINPPTPEWGVLVYSGKSYMLTHPHVILFPCLAVIVSVVSINFFVNGLRDALDPREDS